MKKLVSVLICLVIILTLCACSKDKEESNLTTLAPTASTSPFEEVSTEDGVEETSNEDINEEQNQTQPETTAVAVTNSTKKTAAGAKISWNPVSGATSYKIYRSETQDGKKELIAETKETSYVDKAAGEKTYYYSIQAVKPETTKTSSAQTTKATLSTTSTNTTKAATSTTAKATTSATTKATTASSATTLPASGTVYEKVRAQFRNQIVANPTINAQTLVKNLMSTAGLSTLSYKVDVVQQNQTVPTYYIAPCGNDCNVKAADCKSAYYAYPKNSSGSNSPAARLYIFQATDSSKASAIASEIKNHVHTDYQMCGAPAAENYIVDNYNEYVLLFLK